MKHSRFSLLSIVVIVALLLSIFGPALAASGDLDLTFNGTGYVATDFGGVEEAFAVAVQPDGYIVTAGYTAPGAVKNFALARYDTAGGLDPTFGTISTTIGSGDAVANAVALQADGNIVAAGSSVSDTISGKTVFAVARYISITGALDASFGAGGIVTTTISAGNDAAHAIAIQADNKIVVAGESNARFAVVRYNTNGTLDTSFGGTGIVTTIVVGLNNIAHAVLIQPADGKIIAVGEVDTGISNDFALVRYNSNGALDTSFGTLGKVTTNFPGNTNDIAYTAALQPDGGIVAAGSVSTDGFDFGVARYTANGSLDTSFNSTGRITTSFGPSADEAHGVVVQPTGKIVVGGWSSQGTRKNDFVLARYTVTGTLDSGFGTSGLVTTTLQPTSDDIAYALALQSDNKILVAGSMDSGGATAFDFAVARFQSPNTPPVVVDVAKTGLEDIPITFTPSDFTAAFSDADGDSLAKIMVTSLPANGTLKLNGVNVTASQEITPTNLNNLSFVPDANWNGSTSFSWNGFDGIDYAVADALVNISLTAVNDPPSFTLGPDQTVLINSGPITVTNWATNFSPGPADEITQTLTLSITNGSPSLFSVQPSLDLSGTLTFAPAPSLYGTATVTVTLKDNGGTANGGVDTSAPQTFTITIKPYQIFLPLAMRS